MKNVKITAVLCIVVAISATGWTAMIEFTEDGLDMDEGNYGTSLMINEVLEISAITGITQEGGPFTGTVYLERNGKGFGVQTLQPGGSKGISGGGPDQDEALSFNFIGNVDAASLLIGLNKFNRDKDAPVITLFLSDGTELSFTESHENWDSAVTSRGKEKVIVDMSVFLGAGFSASASSLSVKETTGHLYVNSITYIIPEPATVVMLGFGAGVFLIRPRRRY